MHPRRWAGERRGALGDHGGRPAGRRRPRSRERASRAWWDADADDYLAEHGADIGDVDFVWCPEGLREADAGLLGDRRPGTARAGGRLRLGAVRALAGRPGRRAVALDLSAGMLRHAAEASARPPASAVPLVQADAERLPFADASFDLACSAFGGVPFVAEPERVMREVARVLRPGGRWVFAVNHPMRWMFPDDPGPDGLTVDQSYFDRTPYVEVDAAGAATYVEHHRTLGDRVRDVVAAGLVLRGPGGAGVAGGPRAGVGSVDPAARRAAPRHRDLRDPTADVGRPVTTTPPTRPPA